MWTFCKKLWVFFRLIPVVLYPMILWQFMFLQVIPNDLHSAVLGARSCFHSSSPTDHGDRKFSRVSTLSSAELNLFFSGGHSKPSTCRANCRSEFPWIPPETLFSSLGEWATCFLKLNELSEIEHCNLHTILFGYTKTYLVL